MYARATLQSCPRCGQMTQAWAETCPQCHHRLASPGRIRFLGWVLCSVGIGLTTGMLYLIVLIAGIMRHTHDADATIQFNGDGFAAVMIFGILGVVLIFGTSSIIAGAWQIKHGRRHPRLVRIMLWLGAILIIIGTCVQALN